jgi:small subunit ribosomal protein S2
VVAVVDSNSSPEGVTFPVPGNDDASRAINLYCELMVGAVLDGIRAEMHASGVDMGALEEQVEDEVDEAEAAPAETPAASAAESAPSGGAATAGEEQTPAAG